MIHCPISACNKPTTRVRIYDPEKHGEEPTMQDEGFCVNQHGFHNHEEKVWYKFKKPKVGKERFEGRVA